MGIGGINVYSYDKETADKLFELCEETIRKDFNLGAIDVVKMPIGEDKYKKYSVKEIQKNY